MIVFGSTFKKKAKWKCFWGKSGSEYCRFVGKSLKCHGEFKIIGEVCWLNGVEFRVIDFEMTPKKTAFAFTVSVKCLKSFSLWNHFFFLSVFRRFYKKKISFTTTFTEGNLSQLRGRSMSFFFSYDLWIVLYVALSIDDFSQLPREKSRGHMKEREAYCDRVISLCFFE